MSALHGYVFRSPDPAFCGDCGEECTVEPHDNSFAYAGTHCTGGRAGVHKPAGYGEPVSDCCNADCYTDEELTNIIDLNDCMDFE